MSKNKYHSQGLISVGDFVRIIAEGKDKGEVVQVIGKMKAGSYGYLYKVKSSVGFGWFSRGDLYRL